MKKSIKAALLSAFVFPGMGHIYLKKYIHGVVLTGVSIAGSYYLISKTVEKSLQIVEKMQRGDVPIDITVINELVLTQSTGSETLLLNIVTVTVFICWLIGIVHSYMVGRLQDD